MFDTSILSLPYWISFSSSTSIITLLSVIFIPATRVTPWDSLCWCCISIVIKRPEVELEGKDCCNENLYSTVIAWLVVVYNKTFLAFDGGMLTVGEYSWRVIPSVTLVMYHFKTKSWIPEIGRGALTAYQYIYVCSKKEANSPLTWDIVLLLISA